MSIDTQEQALAAISERRIIIRAGFSSIIPFGGRSEAKIEGCYTVDDVEDAIEMLQITIRSLRRQIGWDAAFADADKREGK